MNLYLRYFDQETLVKSADEAIAFLSGIGEIEISAELENDIRSYIASDNNYPKRYKIRPRIYFIIIKTTAETMSDFKEKKAVRGGESDADHSQARGGKLETVCYGWYEGTLDFKRVLQVPQTGKFQYRDTHFVACCKAESGLDCYNKIVSHLSQRVDPRSQFPSVKGKNFKFRFLGLCKN